MFWSLFQIEKVVTDSNQTLLTAETLSFINKVELDKLSPKNFFIFKQLVCLAKMYEDSLEYGKKLGIDFDGIFQRLKDLPDDKKQVMIQEETSMKTLPEVTEEVHELLGRIPEL